MAESFLFDNIGYALRKIASLANNEVSLAWGVRDELSKLENTLSTTKSVVYDAEKKHLESHEIATWLEQLKNVMSEAEDVFDEFDYEAHRKQVVNTRGGIGKKVRCFFPSYYKHIVFRLKIGHKLKEIREAFDEVADYKTKFHLNTTPLEPRERELTQSFVHACDIIGRDKERDDIVKSLMDSSQGPDENLSVVSVVGLGGLGKTALAKMVFNYSRIVEHFEKRVWVCLGDLKEFSVNQVMVKIVKSIIDGNSVNSDPDQLQCCLRETLRDKRFLLVLDDVWIVERPEWLELKRMLMSGLGGSKVIVTTRNSLVALCMGSVFIQNLEGLPHGECVSLFKKFAFNEGEEDQNLMKIGDGVVRKCKGVPLAIKTLGSMLFLKRNISDWIFVRDSEIWQLDQNEYGILPALKLSYDQLPFGLKQCFVFCSIFPKDYNFSNVRLVQQWSVYGLLHSTDGTKKLEVIGEQYINELCVRGFFQDFEDFSTVSNFKMHDLIHDLALSLAKNEFELRNMSVGRQDQDIYRRIKHVSFSREEGLLGKEVPKSFLKNNSSVRGVMPTIWCMCFDGKNGEARIGELVKTCISKLKHLRILDLRDTASLERLPNSIGTLKHLRFLDLAHCKKLKRLPNSITELYNLETLSFGGCEELEELPKDIGDLINLKQLTLTTKQKCLSAATANGIKSLRSLQLLSFVQSSNLEYLFESEEDDDEARQQWTSLQFLAITDCRSLLCLFRPSTSSPRKRSRLASLETLFIVDCPNLDLASTCNDEISLPCLKSLMLQHMPKMESLPQWVCPSTVQYFAIVNCQNLISLPEWLQTLTSLLKLTIYYCPKLLCLPEGIECLTALEELKIKHCPDLSIRCKQGRGEDWPKIANIPKLDVESA